MLYDLWLPPHAAFAARALVKAADDPGSLVLAMCTDHQGADVPTLCLMVENRLFPFAVVPVGDLREVLWPPTNCMAVRATTTADRRVGFDIPKGTG